MSLNVEPPAEDELLVVVGPTASGKTELALQLCERFNGEVVGADSVQIYRHFDLGSGKPTAEEHARAPHHLIDVVEPDADVDAAWFAATADAAISDIRSRGRTPVVCGGTFLWVKALTQGLAPSPPADQEIRARHNALAEHEGRAAVHAELARVDAVAADKLNPNDLLRVSRALEVFELTGKPMSAWQAEHGFREARYRSRLLGVDRPRPELDTRIRQRVVHWLNNGWEDEVRNLIARGFEQTRAMGSVGYRQMRDFINGDLPEAELEDAIVRATRVFVRRQRTWLRDEPVQWLPAA